MGFREFREFRGGLRDLGGVYDFGVPEVMGV